MKSGHFPTERTFTFKKLTWEIVSAFDLDIRSTFQWHLIYVNQYPPSPYKVLQSYLKYNNCFIQRSIKLSIVQMSWQIHWSRTSGFSFPCLIKDRRAPLVEHSVPCSDHDKTVTLCRSESPDNQCHVTSKGEGRGDETTPCRAQHSRLWWRRWGPWRVRPCWSCRRGSCHTPSAGCPWTLLCRQRRSPGQGIVR